MTSSDLLRLRSSFLGRVNETFGSGAEVKEFKTALIGDMLLPFSASSKH